MTMAPLDHEPERPGQPVLPLSVQQEDTGSGDEMVIEGDVGYETMEDSRTAKKNRTESQDAGASSWGVDGNSGASSGPLLGPPQPLTVNPGADIESFTYPEEPTADALKLMEFLSDSSAGNWFYSLEKQYTFFVGLRGTLVEELENRKAQGEETADLVDGLLLVEQGHSLAVKTYLQCERYAQLFGTQKKRRASRGRALSESAGSTTATDMTRFYQQNAQELRGLREKLKSPGGFSALGRAHEVEVEEHMTDGESDTPSSSSGRVAFGYLKGVTSLGQSATSWGEGHSKKTAWVETAPKPTKGAKPLDRQRVHAAMSSLSPPKSSTEPTMRRKFIAKDRGIGQFQSMGSVSAREYAEFCQVAGHEKTRWEWLHIRAASLGGPTDATNLVLGTRDANTHMMVFEQNLVRLARKVAELSKDNNGLYLKAVWDLDPAPVVQEPGVQQGEGSVGNPYRHRTTGISITWDVVGTAKGDLPDLSGKAVFDPLNTSENISKKEVILLEKQLKQVNAKYFPGATNVADQEGDDPT